MRNNEFTSKGGAKKFLYTGPKKDNDEEDEIPWNFNSSPRGKATTGNLNVGSKFDMDDVWSIKRNVNIGGISGKEPKSDGLTFSTNKSYYSRHGGGSKDKDEFGASFGNSSSNTGSTQQESKSWNTGGPSRRPFSYSFGADTQNPADKPISPRTVSNSSAGIYPQTGVTSSQNFSQTGRGLNSGTNLNTNFGGGGGRNFNSHGGDKFNSNNTSLFNKSLSSSSHLVSQSLNTSPKNVNTIFNSSSQNTTSRNHLFNSKNDSSVNRSPFDAASSNRQDKSFW